MKLLWTTLLLAVTCCVPPLATATPPGVEQNRCSSLRIKDGCERDPMSPTVQRKLKTGGNKVITTTVKVPQRVLQGEGLCEAQVSISYLQLNDKIRVDAVVENDDCAASEGIYTVKTRTLSATGERRVREFEESWRREDAATVEQRHVYDMAGDDRLSRATVSTSRKTLCQCLEEGLEEASP